MKNDHNSVTTTKNSNRICMNDHNSVTTTKNSSELSDSTETTTRNVDNDDLTEEDRMFAVIRGNSWTIVDKFLHPDRFRPPTGLTSLVEAFGCALKLHRARLVIVTCMILLPCLLVLIISNLVAKRNSRWIVLAFVAVLIAMPVYMLRTKTPKNAMLSARGWAIYIILLAYAAVVTLNTLNGAFGNPSITGICVPPALAFAGADKNVALVSFLASLLIFPYLTILHATDFDFPDERKLDQTWDLLVAYPLVFVFVLFPMFLSFRGNEDAIRGLSHLSRKLEQEKSEAEEAKLEAERARQAKSEYMSTMSHELRSPLHAVLALIECSISEHDKKRSNQFLSDALRAGKVLKALVNDVLTFSKLEADRIVFENLCIHLPSLVKEVSTMISIQRSDNDVEFRVNIDDSIDYVMTDSMRLNQILLNFVGNASKFTPRGIITISVKPTSVQRMKAQIKQFDAEKIVWFDDDDDDNNSNDVDSLVEFSVVDTGNGIPRDKLAKIFSPFIQVDASITREFGGTGLGLTIIRGLIHKMHGYLYVHSKQRISNYLRNSDTNTGGTTFTFVLNLVKCAPTTQEEEKKAYTPQVVVRRLYSNSSNNNIMMDGLSDAVNDTEVDPPTISPTDFHDMKILVIDDSKLNLRICKTVMKSLGFEDVSTCIEGENGIKLFTQNQYDIVFTDIHMPTISGYEVAKEMRKIEQQQQSARSVCIFAFSADADANVEQKCKNSGMNGILRKPASRTDILFIMENMIEGEWIDTGTLE